MRELNLNEEFEENEFEEITEECTFIIEGGCGVVGGSRGPYDILPRWWDNIS